MENNMENKVENTAGNAAENTTEKAAEKKIANPVEARRVDFLALMEISKGTGNVKKMVASAMNYSRLEVSDNRPAAAEMCLKEMIQLVSEEEYPEEKATLWEALGDLLTKKNAIDDARENLVKAEKLAREKDLKMRLASALIGLGRLGIRTKDMEVARAHYKEALDIAMAEKYNVLIASALLNLGELDMTEEKYDDSIVNLGNAVQMFAALKDPSGLLFCLRDLCYISGKQKKADKVNYFANQATDLMSKVNFAAGLKANVNQVIQDALKEV